MCPSPLVGALLEYPQGAQGVWALKEPDGAIPSNDFSTASPPAPPWLEACGAVGKSGVGTPILTDSPFPANGASCPPKRSIIIAPPPSAIRYTPSGVRFPQCLMGSLGVVQSKVFRQAGKQVTHRRMPIQVNMFMFDTTPAAPQICCRRPFLSRPC